MLRKIFILSLLACSLCGCIKEDTDDCETGLRFYFSYTHNNQGQDLLASEIYDIRIYLFDLSTGLLADIIDVGREDIVRGWVEPEVAAGTYTAVAWGGSNENMMQGGHHDAEMTDPATHTYTPQASVGTTTLDNFRMMLATDALSGGMRGDVTPRVEQFDNLFFAMATNVKAQKNGGQSVDFDFIKNTSILNIKVTGLDYLTRAPGAGQPLHVFAVGPNERYEHDNTIDPYTREVRYEPPYTTLTGSDMVIDIKIQRLDIACHTARPVMLYIQDPATGAEMFYPLDVMDAILQAEDAGGNRIWPTQEAIDREDVFPFEVSILHDLSMKIAVSGYEIENANPDL